MPVIIFLLIHIASGSSNILSAAIKNYDNVRTYQVTLRSESGGDEEVIRYYYKKPGFVKMEFVKPHRGSVLVYNPASGRVRVTPFGFLPFFYLTLDPDNPFIKSSQGHRIDESDMGELLRSADELQQNGKTVMSGEDDMNGRTALRLVIEGEGEFHVGNIHGYELWLDRENLMPLKAVSFGAEGEPIEEVLMDDIEINVVFPEGFFR